MIACVKRGYIIYNYISKYYIVETFRVTYAVVVHAIGSPGSWAIPIDVKSWFVKEPNVRKLLDRPKKIGGLSQMDMSPPSRSVVGMGKLAILGRLAEVHFLLGALCLKMEILQAEEEEEEGEHKNNSCVQ